MAGLVVLALGLAITMVVLLLGAKRKEASLAATLVEKQQNIERMPQEMVDTQQELESLQSGKALLLENMPFKVCNLSTEGSLRVLWLAAAYIDAEDNMASFDSSAVGYHKWTLNPGGSMKFDFVRDDRVIWDGSAIFFSMLFKHRGKEYFRIRLDAQPARRLLQASARRHQLTEIRSESSRRLVSVLVSAPDGDIRTGCLAREHVSCR